MLVAKTNTAAKLPFLAIGPRSDICNQHPISDGLLATQFQPSPLRPDTEKLTVRYQKPSFAPVMSKFGRKAVITFSDDLGLHESQLSSKSASSDVRRLLSFLV